MTRITVIACIVAAVAISPARSERAGATSGPSMDIVTRWFTGAGGPVCTDAAGSDTACDLGRVLALRTYHDADGEHALSFAAYSPAVSNAVALAVAQFRRGEQGWAFVRTLSGVYGEGPDTMFLNGRATFVMQALLPGDARCCLTGKQRYAVDLATGAVTAGARMPASTASAQAGRRFTSRPEGYEGATYLHNGSTVLVDERVGTIRYEVPKAAMRGTVSKGTILFTGTFASGGKVQGTAYAFKAGCEATPYPVAGKSHGSTIVLKGRAPHRDSNSCAVTGMTDHGAHTILTFSEYGDL